MQKITQKQKNILRQIVEKMNCKGVDCRECPLWSDTNCDGNILNTKGKFVIKAKKMLSELKKETNKKNEATMLGKKQEPEMFICENAFRCKDATKCTHAKIHKFICENSDDYGCNAICTENEDALKNSVCIPVSEYEKKKNLNIEEKKRSQRGFYGISAK